jgi:hypothetical protein
MTEPIVELRNQTGVGASRRTNRGLYRYDVYVDGELAGQVRSVEHETYAKQGRLRRVLGRPVEWRFEERVGPYYRSRADVVDAMVQDYLDRRESEQ